MHIAIDKVEMIQDPRGDVFVFPFTDRNHLSVIHRKAGSVSADHYHPGATKSKSPETFYLAQGAIELFVRDNTTGKETIYTVDAGHCFAIPPNIHHKVTAVTDVILLEFNIAEEYFQSDVVRAEGLEV